MTSTPAQRGEFYTKMYDRLYRLGYHAKSQYSHAQPLCEYLLANHAFTSALDIGCSHGWSVEFLKQHGRNAIGLEISPTAVKQAARLCRAVMYGSATDLPFSDNTFEMVMSTDCFEHLRPEDAPIAVHEAVRVAKPGAVLAFKINPRQDRNKMWKFLAGSSLHLTLQPQEWWMDLFRKEGCKVIKEFPEREEFVLEKNR